MKELRDSFIRLRLDAIERGHQELAIAYGWSAMRLGDELIAKQAEQMKAYSVAKFNARA